MAFRDPQVASYEKRLAKLQKEKDEAQAARQAAEERLEELRRGRERVALVRRLGGALAGLLKLPGRGVVGLLRLVRSVALGAWEGVKYVAMVIFNAFSIWTLLLGGIVIYFGWVGYQYFTDIQEGVVSGRYHTESYTTCTTDSKGITSCTTTPESWSVTIANGGDVATWSVSEEMYDKLRPGDWFCYTDGFHPESDCEGPPADFPRADTSNSN